MTDEQFIELTDLAMGLLDQTGELDVEGFVRTNPAAAGEVEEFLLHLLAWRQANGRSHERIRVGVMVALPDLVKQTRSLTLGDLFFQIDVIQAQALGMRAISYNRVRQDRTLLIDLESPEQQRVKAKELRIDDQLFSALLRQLSDPLQDEDALLFAARHESDPTEEE